MTLKKHLIGFAVLSIVTGTSILSAQNTPPPAPTLANAHRVKCTFTQITTASWENGVPTAETKPADLTLQYSSIDTQEGTAEMPGINQLGSGAPHIIVRMVEGNLHFLAMNSTGSMYVTTVFSDRESRTTGKYKAVHTRHEFTEVRLSSFTSRPEQYIGYCTVLE